MIRKRRPLHGVSTEDHTYVNDDGDQNGLGDGDKIVVSFDEPADREVPPGADEYALASEREPQLGDVQEVLAPGPALL